MLFHPVQLCWQTGLYLARVIQPKSSIHLPKATQCRAMEMDWPVGILGPSGPAQQERWLSWLESGEQELAPWLSSIHPSLVGGCLRELGYKLREIGPCPSPLEFTEGTERGKCGPCSSSSEHLLCARLCAAG